MSARWQRVRTLFLAAAELPPSQQTAFVERSASDDSEIRDEVIALLAADREEPDFPEGLLASPPGLLQNGTPDGGHIGPYRVLGELGRGGMSNVYLASGRDGAQPRRVAVKVIRRDLLSEETRRRFLREQHILARLDHPYVARLLDAGRTDQGWPYVVMEAIEGLPIDHYCDRQDLSLRQRLRLFQRVCSAAHHAHQNLVIHRDLKPSNILVASSGTPKLLDFGIAKLMRPDLSPRDLVVTHPSRQPLTPGYASPEQVRGEPVTTVSDVYALGALLYQILTGHRPHQFNRRGPNEIERIVCHEDPPLPSQTKPPADGTATGIPDNERRLLRGDLDAIVLKALAKEPGRRYRSADQLSEDLDRFLSHRPVHARPPSGTYRLRKLARRNPAATALATLAALFAMMTGFQNMRLDHALDQVHAEQERVVAEQSRNTAVTEFLIDVFRAADPYEAAGNETTAREILDRGARRLTVELAAQPETMATLFDIIGRVYQNLGIFETASSHLENALEMRRKLHGNEHLDVAESLGHLAFLRHQEHRFKEAEELGRQTLKLQIGLRGESHPAVATSLHNLAETLAVQAHYGEAEELYRRALAMRRELLGPSHTAVAESLGELGLMSSNQEDPQKAVPLLREAVDIWQEQLGPDHPTLAQGFGHLAHALDLRGEHAEAEQLLKKALVIQKKVLEEDHPDVLGNLAMLGRAYRQQGRLHEAEATLSHFIEKNKQDSDPLLGTVYTDLGLVYLQNQRFAEARVQLHEALDLYRQIFGSHHPSVAVVLAWLGRVAHQQRDLAEATASFREAAAIWRHLAPEARDHGKALFELGRALRRQEKWFEAVPLLRVSRAALLRADSPQWAAIAGSELAFNLMRLDRLSEARSLLLESREALGNFSESSYDWAALTEKRLDMLEALANH